MKLLRELYHNHNNSDKPCEKFRLRKAARSLVLNHNSEIALMNVSKHGYYKLPGGGIELGEDIQKALAREIKEEVGAKIEVLRELGCIVEYGNELELLQINYCFVSKLIGKLEKPEFTETELSDGFALEWHTIEKAIKLLETCKPTVLIGKGIVSRDLTFLNEYSQTEKKTKKHARVGVGVIVINKDNCVLLGKRNKAAKRTHSKLNDNWDWSLPGGGLEYGEEIEDCAIREVKEETGLDIKNVKIFSVTNDVDKLAHWITIGTYSKEFSGKPSLTEPDKFTEWRWFPLDNLPSNIFFPSARSLENFKKGKKL